MDSFKRMVNNMMARYGGIVTLVSVGDATYDPATSESVAAETTYFVAGAMFDFALQKYGLQAMAGTQIQMGDKQVLLKPTDVNGNAYPAIRPERDFVEFAGRRYKIVTLKDTNPTMADSLLIELVVRA